MTLLAGSLVLTAALPAAAWTESAPPGSAAKATPLLNKMVGTWDVRQRMWAGSGAEAVDLPPAVARRTLIQDSYLQEVMQLAQPSSTDAFTRTAYLNYNAVSRKYEYFSLDTRAPQQMTYASDEQDARAEKMIKFNGGMFVASRWGDASNVAFKYRLEVGRVESDRQTVRLFLTPQAESHTKEFLAFEYVYNRQR